MHGTKILVVAGVFCKAEHLRKQAAKHLACLEVLTVVGLCFWINLSKNTCSASTLPDQKKGGNIEPCTFRNPPPQQKLGWLASHLWGVAVLLASGFLLQN